MSVSKRGERGPVWWQTQTTDVTVGIGMTSLLVFAQTLVYPTLHTVIKLGVKCHNQIILISLGFVTCLVKTDPIRQIERGKGQKLAYLMYGPFLICYIRLPITAVSEHTSCHNAL